MARLFHLREAERLLPSVDQALRRALDLKRSYEDAHTELTSTLRKLHMLGGVIPDSNRIASLRATSQRTLEDLKAAVSEIEEYGCLVKDLDMGLIDFLTRYHGREVCLCWKLGEEGIHFWHGSEEGFRGRKPIDDEFLANHSGDHPSP